MVVLYAFVALLGALSTFIALASHGWLLALLLAPLGASGLTLISAVIVFFLSSQIAGSRLPSSAAPYTRNARGLVDYHRRGNRTVGTRRGLCPSVRRRSSSWKGMRRRG